MALIPLILATALLASCESCRAGKPEPSVADATGAPRVEAKGHEPWAALLPRMRQAAERAMESHAPFTIHVDGAERFTATTPVMCHGGPPPTERLETCAVPHVHVNKGGTHVAWEAVRVDPAKRYCEMGRLLRAVSIPGTDVTPVQPLAEWDQQYLLGTDGACPTARIPGELQTALSSVKTAVPICGRAVLSGSQVTTSEVIAMFDAAQKALPELLWSLSPTPPYAPNAPCEIK